MSTAKQPLKKRKQENRHACEIFAKFDRCIFCNLSDCIKKKVIPSSHFPEFDHLCCSTSFWFSVEQHVIWLKCLVVIQEHPLCT